jgi:hypothetical protein
MTSATTHSLRLTHTIRADAERLFRAWIPRNCATGGAWKATDGPSPRRRSI